MKNEKTDVIETYIMFGTEVKVIVKIKKTTVYGSSQPEYKLAEVAGVVVQSEVFDEDINKFIVRRIREDAVVQVKDYEEEMCK